MTLINLLRSRLLSDPSDATLISLRIELDEAGQLLKTLAPIPPSARISAINLSTLINEEEENPYIFKGNKLTIGEKE